MPDNSTFHYLGPTESEGLNFRFPKFTVGELIVNSAVAKMSQHCFFLGFVWASRFSRQSPPLAYNSCKESSLAIGYSWRCWCHVQTQICSGFNVEPIAGPRQQRTDKTFDDSHQEGPAAAKWGHVECNLGCLGLVAECACIRETPKMRPLGGTTVRKQIAKVWPCFGRGLERHRHTDARRLAMVLPVFRLSALERGVEHVLDAPSRQLPEALARLQAMRRMERHRTGPRAVLGRPLRCRTGPDFQN